MRLRTAEEMLEEDTNAANRGTDAGTLALVQNDTGHRSQADQGTLALLPNATGHRPQAVTSFLFEGGGRPPALQDFDAMNVSSNTDQMVHHLIGALGPAATGAPLIFGPPAQAPQEGMLQSLMQDRAQLEYELGAAVGEAAASRDMLDHAVDIHMKATTRTMDQADMARKAMEGIDKMKEKIAKREKMLDEREERQQMQLQNMQAQMFAEFQALKDQLVSKATSSSQPRQASPHSGAKRLARSR